MTTEDYIPVKPEPKPKVIVPPTEICKVCKHLKYTVEKHVDGSSYKDRERCLNCPTCKASMKRGKSENRYPQ